MHSEANHLSVLSAADLSLKRFYIVKTDASGNAVLAAAATDAILGVLDDGGRKSGDTVDVVAINGHGTFRVVAGGTITKDAYLTSDASGKAVATTTTGNRVFGRAVKAAVAGDIVEYIKCNERAQ